ncbi:hypothetical protein Hanom_Chr11g01002751 [Helianthus anomalus]
MENVKVSILNHLLMNLLIGAMLYLLTGQNTEKQKIAGKERSHTGQKLGVLC